MINDQSGEDSVIYELDQFTIDGCKLYQSGQDLDFPETTVRLLRYLCSKAVRDFGQGVTSEELLQACWPSGVSVDTHNVEVRLSKLRKELGKELLTHKPYRLGRRPKIRSPNGSTVERFASSVTALTIGVLGTLFVTVPSRALIAMFGLTLTQIDAGFGFFQGLFHGCVGAVVWGVCIGAGVLLASGFGRLGVDMDRSSPTRGRVPAVVGGLIGGVLGGLVIESAVLLIYSAGARDSSQLNAFPMALSFPFLGASIGAGVGWTAKLLPTRQSRAAVPFALRDFGRLCRRAVFRIIINSGALALFMAAAIVMVSYVSFPQRSLRENRATHLPASGKVAIEDAGNATALNFLRALTGQSAFVDSSELVKWKRQAGKLIGEGLSLYFGGVGLVIGLFIGKYLRVQVGLSIDGDRAPGVPD